MRSPIALAWPWINFDGLLAHLEFRRKLGEGYRTLPTKRVVDPIPSLPLASTQGVYHCSVSIFPNESIRAMATFYKRFASNLMQAEGKGKIDRGRGFFKDYILRTPYLATNEVVFHLVLLSHTYEDWLKELLEGLPGLGKEVNIGFGMIDDFRLERIDVDMGLVAEQKGGSLAMRPIPISLLSEYEDVERLCYRPPYWDRSGAAPCAVPFTKVRLKKVSV